MVPLEGWKEPKPDEATSNAASKQWLWDSESLRDQIICCATPDLQLPVLSAGECSTYLVPWAATRESSQTNPAARNQSWSNRESR